MVFSFKYFLFSFLGFSSLLFAPLAFADGAADSIFNRTYGMAQGLSFNQNLNAQLPLAAEFTDENGRKIKLQEYFTNRPVIVTMGYYGCPNTCNVVFRETFQTLQNLKLSDPNAFEMIFVSIDSTEGPALALKKKKNYLRSYKDLPLESQVHFLTGSEENIKNVANTIGFEYRYDETAKQFIHPSGIIIATPEGKLSRYLYGIRFSGRDLKLALVEASQNKIGNLVDQFLLFCYRYDPSQGKYGLAIMGAVRGIGLVTMAALLGYIFTMVRRERRRNSDSNSKEGNA